jgi:hypothetical protein
MRRCAIGPTRAEELVQPIGASIVKSSVVHVLRVEVLRGVAC